MHTATRIISAAEGFELRAIRLRAHRLAAELSKVLKPYMLLSTAQKQVFHLKTTPHLRSY